MRTRGHIWIGSIPYSLPPAGHRKYTVHTSAIFQRSQDQKNVEKVFVTYELTISGLGSHSAAGEEWTDNDNAVWTDLDERKPPKSALKLFAWATREGWRQGSSSGTARGCCDKLRLDFRESGQAENQDIAPACSVELVRQIEALEKVLGKGLYADC